MKIRLILLIVTFISLQVSAIEFYSINELFGISVREMASVCKDKNGFVWASSKTGVLRLTEDDYRFYDLPFNTTDVLNVKLVYHPTDFVAYTNNGQVFRYNPVADKFESYFNIRSILNINHLVVKSLFIDNKGVLWFATSTGLYKYYNNHLEIIYKAEVFEILSKDEQNMFVFDQDGIWVMNPNTQKRTLVCTIKGFTTNTACYDPKSEKIWVGSFSNGLYCYDLKSKSLVQIQASIFPKQPILSVELYSDSTILVGVDGQGIWEINKFNNRILNVYKENVDDPTSLKGDGVYDIFCDDDKRVWICTYSRGLSYFNRSTPLVKHITHQINNRNSLVNNNVNHIIEDSRGNIWFATDNGISCWNVVANQWKTYYNNKNEQAKVFLSLCEDNKGRIWAGTYSSGVYVIDGKTGRELAQYLKDQPGSPLSSNFIFDVFRDSQNKLWIGGVNGDFICYDTNLDKYITYSSQPIYSIAELSENELLLACTYGLCKLNKQTGDLKVLFKDYVVKDVAIVDSCIWVCTSGNGLIKFKEKDGIVKIITTKTGLPSNYVNSIEYADGYLWLGTENGFCRYNPVDNQITTYSSIFPLMNVSFNGQAVCKLKNGQLAWGTNNGAVIFSPGNLYQVIPRGRIFIQDITVLGRSIRDKSVFDLVTPVDSLKNIRLSYNQNALSIELLSIGDIIRDAKYSCKLEGFDTEWSMPSSQRFVNYTNLPNGSYTLKIKLYDNSLTHLIDERSVDILITPPIWKTWWFKILTLLVFGGLVFFALRFYFNYLNRIHSEEKVRFFANTAHDIRTSLTLINGPVEELRKEKNLSEKGLQYTRLISKQAQRLSSVVTQLMDFQKVDVGKGQLALRMVDVVQLIQQRIHMFESYAQKNNISIKFDSNTETYQTAIDELKIEKVVDNLISNAIKYSHPESDVNIALQCDKDQWRLEIKDKGIGISSNAQQKLFKEFYRSENAVNSKIIGSGIGLLLVKQYVTMHEGKVWVVSKENQGSEFNIMIPYKQIEQTESPATFSTRSEILASVPNNDMASTDFEEPKSSNEHSSQILIVEDNSDLRNFICSALSSEFDVIAASDGVEAWERIQENEPNLIVSDIMMPNRNGFELCEMIKSNYETSHIPIILLTSLSEKTQQLQGLGLGAEDYLTKPFDITILTQRIKAILRNRQLVMEKAMKSHYLADDEQILENTYNDEFVKKAMEVVYNNIANENFDKNEFASSMNVSSSLLYKKIKALTDKSPVELIKEVRLNHAMKLIKNREYTITEISELCGFSSLGYFSTAFRKYFGKSPSDI